MTGMKIDYNGLSLLWFKEEEKCDRKANKSHSLSRWKNFSLIFIIEHTLDEKSFDQKQKILLRFQKAML